MTKLTTAMATTIVAAGVVAGGIVALDGEGAIEAKHKTAQQSRMVVLSDPCPIRPEAPQRVVCWTERGQARTYADCTDSERMGECGGDALEAEEARKAKEASPCPMCILGCESTLSAEHDAAVAEYERAREQCPQGMRTVGERCACYTDAEAAPDDAQAVADIPSEHKRILLRCEVDDKHGEGSHVVTRWAPAHRPVPRICVQVGRAVFDPRSKRNVQTDFYASMQEACDPYPIRPGDHGHCPACVGWRDGCPPCRVIAERYGERWRGHEDECEDEIR